MAHHGTATWPQAGVRTPARWLVRWDGYNLYIGRDLWDALGGVPPVVSFRLHGAYTYIVPWQRHDVVPRVETYIVVDAPGAVPYIMCGEAAAVGPWEVGPRPGLIVDGAIRFHRTIRAMDAA